MFTQQEMSMPTQKFNLPSYSEKFIAPSENKYVICCFSEKWCFNHQGISIDKEYDEDDCLCFKFLDCCSWCLEFNYKRGCLCPKRTICFMGCCSITFD